ncbi:hypothetical protein BS78_05G212100, partial [Paspalum vaginatum]
MAEIEYKLRSGITITIKQWDHGDATPSYNLDELWVHVTGVPHAWHHYLGFWAVGSMIGTTLEVDMLIYRKKGVIRLLVGLVDKEQLSLTTYIVFHKVGYDITFTLEDQDFEPAILPPSTLNFNGGGDGEDRKDSQGQEPDQAYKKMKNLANPSSSLTSNVGTGSATMQVDGNESHTVNLSLLGPIALTPFGKNPVKRSRPRASNGDTVADPDAVTKPRTPYTESVPQQVKQACSNTTHNSIARTPGRNMEPVARSMLNGCSAGAEIAQSSPRTANKAVEHTPISGTPNKNSCHFNSVDGLRRSLRCNVQAADGSLLTDVDMTTKAMQRTAVRNLDANL